MSLKIETSATRAQFEQTLLEEEREFAKKLDDERALLPQLRPLSIKEKETEKQVKKEWESGAKIQARRDEKHRKVQIKQKIDKIFDSLPSPSSDSPSDDSDDSPRSSPVNPDALKWL